MTTKALPKGRRLEGKVAIVTGAGRGVGRAYALALAAEGAKVIVNDLGGRVEGGGGAHSASDAVVTEIESAGGSALANYDDVADFAGAGRIAQATVERFGRLDILIANAGIIRPRTMHEADSSDWTDVMAVHANGTFNCYRHAVPHMIKQGGGSVITTGAAPIQGYFPGLAAYRAAKAAILVLTLNAAEEVRKYNINVNSIMPGATESRMQNAFMESLPESTRRGFRLPAPAQTIPPLGVFLCTDRARDITGKSFHVYGNSISVAISLGDQSSLTTSDSRWDPDELGDRVTAWARGQTAA